ncbi:phosphoglycolate phosphatase [Paracandidimonas soli]|uniref:phosphoglycolate phosphatase n=1 Tax=Paracandidimonas soli TaxID=1917182 RepID=UPI0033410F3A
MTRLVLFDFDGTLVDSAPNLALAANRQRERRGLPPLPYEAYRPHASHGARGLLKVALDMDSSHPEYDETRQQFLDDYAGDMTSRTSLFPGIAELLDALDAEGLAWGIVTNKLSYLALPLIEHLGLSGRTRVIVGGDTTGYSKPHPEPLQYAARTAGFACEASLYIGDDERDIIAGKAAGMPTIAATYGYCDPASAAQWQADCIASRPIDLHPAIRRFA